MIEPNLERIYLITNSVTGKVYVGRTKKTLQKRLNKHLADLKAGTHHSVKAQRAAAKYGVESFNNIKLIEEWSAESIAERETYWIRLLNSAKTGYNIHESGAGPRGTKRSAETRAKMSASFKGRKYSPEASARIGLKKGHKWTEKQREVYATRPKGPLSNEERLRRYATRIGRPKSSEHRAKLDSHLKDLGLKRLGAVVSSETRAKISATMKIRRAERKDWGKS